MKTDIKKLWTDALVSKDYEQTSGRLRDDNGFCCLGVLCDVARKEGLGDWVGGPNNTQYAANGTCQSEVLPADVYRWAGLDRPNPDIRGDNRWDSLAGLNDAGRTFEEIADIIEEHL